ncbi:diacylglycerol kinase [Ramlibacter sp. H39-3-26]|uniref:diacylglycerol kinase n=1 Tax=Curvibacter soli TaxID=3031331 RepID=UPI0023DAD52D|nr:diacylglycerol kinase [Ramlibacter sp. H39-3-26]MDF1485226.1 diacylglycerol kinase [Ramlibacter sp. H39-3-26]
MPASPSPIQTQKARKGLDRLWHATRHSWAGLHCAWGETAFRQEAIAAAVLLPLALWVGRTWVETALLAGCVVLLLIAELLNTAVESAVNRVGPEWHAFSKRAKDVGSAAVLLALLLCAGIWATALYQRFLA